MSPFETDGGVEPIDVLHVDDEPDLADLAATFLERHDDRIDVRTTTGPDAGLDILTQDDVDIDCIVSDYEMPGTNGIEFLQIVREEYPELPFILFTGKGSEEVASDAITAGVTDYLQKETGTDQYTVLGNRITNAVESYRSKRALTRRNQELHRHEQLVNTMLEAACIYDAQANFEMVNDFLAEWLGTTPEDLVGESSTLIQMIRAEHDGDPYQELLEGERTELSGVIEGEFPGQGYAVLEYRLTPLEVNGTIEKVVGVTRDVTEQREYVRRLDTLIDNLPGMVYRCENRRGWPMKRVRGAVETLTGYSASVIENDETIFESDIIHEDYRDMVWETVQDALAAGESYDVTYRIRTRGGDTKWVREHGQQVDVKADDESTLEGFITDISEQEERIRELERREEYLDHVSDFISVVAADGTVRFQSAPTEEITGFSAQEIMGEDGFSHVHPDDREGLVDLMGSFVDGSMTEATVELRVQTADGDWRWIEARAVNKLEDPLVEGIIVSSRDITPRKRYEQKLTALHDVAADLTTMQSVEGVCQRTIEASQEILEFDLSSIGIEESGMLRRKAISADLSVEEFAEMPVEEGIAGKTYRSGETFLIDDVAAEEDAKPKGPYKSAVSVPVGDHGVFQAVSESTGAFEVDDCELAELLVSHTANALDRLERERELERQKEHLDEFASVVSHDLRNPLNVAQGRLELAREDRHPSDEHLEQATQSIERSLDLIGDVLSLAREGVELGAVEPVPMADVLEACWQNVETEAATLDVETERVIRADRSRLKQLLENLFTNAVEHAGPSVRVTVGDLDGGIYFEDDGSGIPEDDRETVFDPGYSSREVGTGFGLNIVERIAMAHGWDISVTEAESGGARFEITDVAFAEG